MQEIPSADTHGTMMQYRRGCRCVRCRMAASDVARLKRQRVKNGTADFHVSAELAAAHLRELSKNGMGLRAIEECTGIQRARLRAIKYCRKRIRQSTEQRIMALHASAKSGGAWMYATFANAMVEEMLGAGWSRARIARAMGNKCGRLAWYGRKKIRVSTRVRFSAVYEQFKREAA